MSPAVDSPKHTARLDPQENLSSLSLVGRSCSPAPPDEPDEQDLDTAGLGHRGAARTVEGVTAPATWGRKPLKLKIT